MHYVELQFRLGNNLGQFAGALARWGYDKSGNLNFGGIAGKWAAPHIKLFRFMIPKLKVITCLQARVKGVRPTMSCYEAYTWCNVPTGGCTPSIMRRFVTLLDTPNQPECVVHIRGEDFTYLRDYMDFVVGRRYLLEGLERCGVAPGDAVVCTNDRELARKVLPEARVHDVRGLFGGIMQDFSVCTKSRYLIMSPSTFALWAAYMGNHEKVIFPSRWPRNTHCALNRSCVPPFDMKEFLRPNYEVVNF